MSEFWDEGECTERARRVYCGENLQAAQPFDTTQRRTVYLGQWLTRGELKRQRRVARTANLLEIAIVDEVV